MQKRDYDKMYDKNTGSTETHVATDERLAIEDLKAYAEGFASASGVRPETAETGGRLKHPETKDAAHVEGYVDNMIEEEENAGLADA